jgi:signal transduction histidine kinase
VPTATPPDGLQAQLARLRAEQERLFSDLQAGETHFRRLARSVWRIEEEERRRIARDLHDGVGQDLTALRHRIEAARTAGGAEERSTRLDEALALCDRALDETRSLARLLRPQILDDLGLEAAIRWLARRCSEAASCSVDVDVGLGDERLGQEVSTVAFRLVQEALTNVIRHAQARHVSIRVARRGEFLQVLVADDGRGFDPDATPREPGHAGAGVSGMRERVQLFGGRFSIASAPGEGVQVRAQLPLVALEPR